MEQKTIYTKLLIIGILCSLLACYSCNKGEIDKLYSESYNYTNKSNHNLKIEKWQDGNSNIFNLDESEIINFKIDIGVGGGCSLNGESSNICPLIFADSLKIIFDNDKSILLKPKDTRDINIFNEGNYENATVGNKSTHNYIFSEKDYLEAN